MNKEFETIRKGAAHLQIGKNGLTEGMVSHMEELLKTHHTIKIKVLKSVADYVKMEKIIEEIMRKLRIYVADARGHTAIISIWDNMKEVKYPKKYLILREKIDEQIQKELETQGNTKLTDSTPIDYDNEELMEKLNEQAEKIVKE